MTEEDIDMSARTNFAIAFVIIAVFLMVPAGLSAQQPTNLEYPYIYKSTRAMGMGGAYTAVGGRVDSLFYNPAGLINIPQDKGWEVNLINLSVEVGKNMADLKKLIQKKDCGDNTFCKDMQDALDQDKHPSDADQLQAVNNVLANYRGKNMHMRIADFTSIGKSYDRWAFGLGGIASGRLDAMSHEGFGSNGLLEVNADTFTGGIGGASIGFTNNVFGGIAIKSLHRESLIHDFTARELVDHQSDLNDYIQKDLKVSGDGIGFDAGLIWKFAPESRLKPSFGASILNVGDMKFGNAGKLPQTVNTGIAINPTIPVFRSLTVAVDYIDVLNNYKQDKDMSKRLRYGAELQLFDKLPVEMSLRAGMYEGTPTFGADLRLLIFSLSYVMYTEQLGAYPGQDKDKRQLVTLDIGW
jgi:hypothetical protein